MKKEFETKEYKIISKKPLSDNVSLFALSGKLVFKPGQFVEATAPNFGAITLAPCSDPRDKREFQLCVRSQGSTSNAISNFLPGNTISLRGPYGNSWVEKKISSQELIIITGGMGIVPLRPLILELTNRLRPKKLRIFCGFKDPQSILFEEDLANWKRKTSTSVIVEHTDGKFNGEHGMITDLLEKSKLQTNSTVFMCGPEIMYTFCAKVLNKKGIGDTQIYVSLERRMECGIGVCQHCSCGKHLVCQDGPIFRFDKIRAELNK